MRRSPGGGPGLVHELWRRRAREPGRAIARLALGGSRADGARGADRWRGDRGLCGAAQVKGNQLLDAARGRACRGARRTGGARATGDPGATRRDRQTAADRRADDDQTGDSPQNAETPAGRGDAEIAENAGRELSDTSRQSWW